MACPFADEPTHVCRNSDGRTPPRPGTDCYAAAAADLHGAVTDEALAELLEAESKKNPPARSMSQIGAGDIAVGQQWRFVIAELRYRKLFTVVERLSDKARLKGDDGEEVTVSFGTLLAYWQLVREVASA